MPVETAIDEFYILATSSPESERVLILKHGDAFGVFNHFGDIDSGGRNEEGLYYEGTRFLSTWRLRLAGNRPLLLSSSVRRDNGSIAVDLTNPDLYSQGKLALPHGSLHIYRSSFVWSGAYYERIHLRNFLRTPLAVTLVVDFAADYRDIFEVRGDSRPRRGSLEAARIEGSSVALGYEGLDGVKRTTRITADPRPSEISDSEVRCTAEMEPGAERVLTMAVACEVKSKRGGRAAYDAALKSSNAALEKTDEIWSQVVTSNQQFNTWLDRSRADLNMMLTKTEHGLYPYGGVPWFSTPFGRDGIITALECLWTAPAIARGVLSYLAATQATEVSAEQDAEPGKILHETRSGEMAALKEVPFGRYYGSIDSTPLFVMLAGAYHRRTGDLEFISSIWPHIDRALTWIDKYGDPDRDGFVEYHRKSAQGLVQQGWKDSRDSIFHEDGTLAEGPIALCEVQGYVFAAKLGAAELASHLGHARQADELCEQAGRLKDLFNEKFWCEELGTYGLALDGAKRLCRVRASNAGHCLYTGIAPKDKARRVADSLMEEAGFSGWGIRTVAKGESRYNPMSYHDGSVWPHDNAIAAAGFANYGLKEHAGRILNGIFEASTYVNLNRLPELFCGFSRRPRKAPTLYPVACSPQSWAAAAVFLLLSSCLGIDIDASGPDIVLNEPILPAFLEHVNVSGIVVGGASTDLAIIRSPHGIAATAENRRGKLDVTVCI